MKYFKVKFRKVASYYKEFFVSAYDKDRAKTISKGLAENSPTTDWDLEESEVTEKEIEELGDASEFK